MARPSPSPPCARVVVESAWRKRSKMYGRNSGAMPWPVSATRTTTCGSSRSTVTVTRPPEGVNLIALDSRFHDLLQAMCVAPRRTGGGIDAALEHDGLGLGAEGDGVERRFDDGADVHRLELEAELAGDDARDVEQVVDQLRLQLGVAVDHLQRPLAGGHVEIRALQHAHPAQHRRERRAQLVR